MKVRVKKKEKKKIGNLVILCTCKSALAICQIVNLYYWFVISRFVNVQTCKLAYLQTWSWVGILNCR